MPWPISRNSIRWMRLAIWRRTLAFIRLRALLESIPALMHAAYPTEGGRREQGQAGDRLEARRRPDPLPDTVQRVGAALARADHAHAPLWLEVAARTSQQAADALGVEVGQIAKSVIFRRVADNVAAARRHLG